MLKKTYLVSLIVSVVFATGCTKLQDTKATAILRVNRSQFAGNASEFLIYQETLASLLKSRMVVNAALSKLGRTDLDPEIVQNNVKAQIREGSELLSIELEHADLDRVETAQLLTKVVEAFFDEVVNKERLEGVESLSKLRKRYSQLFDQVKKKTDSISALSKQLGSSDSSQAQALLSIKIDTLKHIQRRLTDAKMNQAKWELKKDDMQIELTKATIQSLTERYDSIFAEIAQIGGISGDLEARKNDLIGLKKDMQSVRESIQQVEVKLDGPESVVVIQTAQ